MAWKYSKNYKSNGRMKKKTMAKKQEQLQREYNMICAQLGEKQFHIKVMEAQVEEGNMRLLQINKEMKELNDEEAKNTPVATKLAFAQPSEVGAEEATPVTEEAPSEAAQG